MHQITELPAWERLFKRIVWSQIGDLKGLSVLDFGSGEGVTADHYAADNTLTAVEPSDEMLANAWKDHTKRRRLLNFFWMMESDLCSRTNDQ